MISIPLLLKTDEKEIVKDGYEKNENDYQNFVVFITPNLWKK